MLIERFSQSCATFVKISQSAIAKLATKPPLAFSIALTLTLGLYKLPATAAPPSPPTYTNSPKLCNSIRGGLLNILASSMAVGEPAFSTIKLLILIE